MANFAIQKFVCLFELVFHSTLKRGHVLIVSYLLNFVCFLAYLVAHLPPVTDKLDVSKRVVVQQVGAEVDQVQPEVPPHKVKHLRVQKFWYFHLGQGIRKWGGNLIRCHGTAASLDLSEKVNM